MRVEAKNPEHRAKYCILLDGVDISDAVVNADDVVHEVTVVIRRENGERIRRENNAFLTAKLRGHVTIVPKVGALHMAGTS